MAGSDNSYPKSRVDLAFKLKRIHFNVNDSVNELLVVLELDEEKKDSISCLFRRINICLKKVTSHFNLYQMMEGGITKSLGNHAQR